MFVLYKQKVPDKAQWAMLKQWTVSLVKLEKQSGTRGESR